MSVKKYTGFEYNITNSQMSIAGVQKIGVYD